MPQSRLNFAPAGDGSRRRSQPRRGLSKEERSRVAHHVIKQVVPGMLRSHARAAQGVQGAQLLRGQQVLPALARGQAVSSSSSSSTVNTTSAVPTPPANAAPFRVRLVAKDSFAAAREYRTQYPHCKIAVLNMASTYKPGGGVLNGARAQEESLCVRSTLYASLDDRWYRLPEDGVAWSPDVLVFAEPDRDRWIKMLDRNDLWYVDVVSCAAIRNPETTGMGNGEYADPRDEEQMVLKIKYIMRACVRMGARRVVLGALGCGAYGNPIDKVAGMMKRILLGRSGSLPDEDWGAAGIDEITIAILDDTPGQQVWSGFVRVFASADNAAIEILQTSGPLSSPAR